MKKNKLLLLPLLLASLISTGCGGTSTPVDPNIDIGNETELHYLCFNENGATICKMPVFEYDTYEDLFPFFPTLDQVPGKIKYWEGDFKYDTDDGGYNHDHQFKIYDAENKNIDIYSKVKPILN